MFRYLVTFVAVLSAVMCVAPPSYIRAAAPTPAASAMPAASALPATSPAPVSSGASPSASLQQFSKEDDAQKYCPHDSVVWLVPTFKVYFDKDEGLYGKTKRGAYACRKEAEAAGYTISQNGHGLRNR